MQTSTKRPLSVMIDVPKLFLSSQIQYKFFIVYSNHLAVSTSFYYLVDFLVHLQHSNLLFVVELIL